MIRVATDINSIPTALEMVEYCHELGYETTINIMAISNANESNMRYTMELIAESNVDVIYLVDSYGSIYLEKMHELADLYIEYMELVGIHAHNNQQLAFANTIEALSQGALSQCHRIEHWQRCEQQPDGTAYRLSSEPQVRNHPCA